MDRHSEGAKKYLAAILCCTAAVVLDQATKHLAVVHLKLQKEIVLIPDVFELRYLENRGAAFGLFQNRQVFFIAAAVVIFFLIGFIYGKIPSGRRFIPMRACAVLICAGAVGNLIDRIRLHYVVDFFYFSLIDFPVFNVADCYAVIACFLFGYLILFFYKEEELEWFTFFKDK